jgi:sortase B
MSDTIKKFIGKVKNLFNKPKLRKIFIIIDCLILIISLTYCIVIFYNYYSSRKLYSTVAHLYTVNAETKAKPTAPSADTSNSSNVNTEPQPTFVPPDSNEVKISNTFLSLLQANKDTVGWIKIDNTYVNYPVVKYLDNDFYLDKNFYKEYSFTGCIFMDYRNNILPLDKNIILYGHNMKDVSMFHDILKYKDEDFFNNNDKITFNTLYKESVWQVFSAYVTEVNFNYLITDFPSDKDFANYITVIRSKSKFKKDISVTTDDHILTLSTCSYEFKDARTVVNAKLLTDR